MDTTLTLNAIEAIMAEAGYEVTESHGNLLKIRDPDSNVCLHAVLEEDLFYMSVVLSTVPESTLSAGMMRRMLASDNGISTSNFQIYELPNGKVAVSLNNFCKLQSLGEDDRDDILSCLSYLLADVVQAKTLLGQDIKS